MTAQTEWGGGKGTRYESSVCSMSALCSLSGGGGRNLYSVVVLFVSESLVGGRVGVRGSGDMKGVGWVREGWREEPPSKGPPTINSFVYLMRTVRISVG